MLEPNHRTNAGWDSTIVTVELSAAAACETESTLTGFSSATITDTRNSRIAPRPSSHRWYIHAL